MQTLKSLESAEQPDTANYDDNNNSCTIVGSGQTYTGEAVEILGEAKVCQLWPW